jgi:hypothetical protein
VVLRHDPRGVLAIGQPAHAWLCGQLARAWGNERFGDVHPLEEVALGAEQHDVGMAELDLDPPLDPETGLPRSFMDLELEVHLELWRRGPARLVSQSPYAALLAAIHGRRLYERRDLGRMPPERARRIRAFLEESRAFEDSLLGALRHDPLTESQATPQLVSRNSQLVWTWDLVSLALLLDWAPLRLEAVPAAGGAEPQLQPEVELELTALSGRGDVARFSLEPWPFAAPEVPLRCDGRRLTQRFSSQEELREGFERAPWESVRFELVPGSPA